MLTAGQHVLRRDMADSNRLARSGALRLQTGWLWGYGWVEAARRLSCNSRPPLHFGCGSRRFARGGNRGHQKCAGSSRWACSRYVSGQVRPAIARRKQAQAIGRIATPLWSSYLTIYPETRPRRWRVIVRQWFETGVAVQIPVSCVAPPPERRTAE